MCESLSVCLNMAGLKDGGEKTKSSEWRERDQSQSDQRLRSVTPELETPEQSVTNLPYSTPKEVSMDANAFPSQA